MQLNRVLQSHVLFTVIVTVPEDLYVKKDDAWQILTIFRRSDNSALCR